jgi:hypothetical protein
LLGGGLLTHSKGARAVAAQPPLPPRWAQHVRASLWSVVLDSPLPAPAGGVHSCNVAMRWLAGTACAKSQKRAIRARSKQITEARAFFSMAAAPSPWAGRGLSPVGFHASMLWWPWNGCKSTAPRVSRARVSRPWLLGRREFVPAAALVLYIAALQPGGINAYVVQREPTPGGPGSGLRPGRRRFLSQLSL